MTPPLPPLLWRLLPIISPSNCSRGHGGMEAKSNFTLWRYERTCAVTLIHHPCNPPSATAFSLVLIVEALPFHLPARNWYINRQSCTMLAAWNMEHNYNERSKACIIALDSILSIQKHAFHQAIHKFQTTPLITKHKSTLESRATPQIKRDCE